MAIIRKYANPQDVETINSRPQTAPLPGVHIAITPNAEVVSTTTQYETYTWSDPPALYYHDTGQELTFTGSITQYVPFTVVEWFWDFGDGKTATGNPVTHTYLAAVPDLVCHLRVRNSLGVTAWASKNPMLRPTGEPLIVGAGVLFV